jgi:hypothetical protein
MSHYPLPSDLEKHTLGRFYHSPPSLSSSPAPTPLTLTPPDPAPLRAHPTPRVVPLDSSHAPIDPRETPFRAHVINPQPLLCSVQPRLSSPHPSSPLVEKPAFQAEAVHRARERAREKCRYETLARAEQVFATVLERSRRERLAALLLRAQQGDELKERERVTREFERLEHERDRRRVGNNISHVQCSGFRVLARVPPSIPAAQQRQAPDRFFYTFPIPSTSPTRSATLRQHQGSMRMRSDLAALTSPNATSPRSVSFDGIRASMGNSLFPIAHGESVSGKTRRESELLGTLLDPVHWQEGERWSQRGRVNGWASRVPEIVPECEACASATLSLDGFSVHSPQTPLFPSDASVSTSTSITSRPISWLSFGSRKFTSPVDTAKTTVPPMINCLPSSADHPIPRHSYGCTRGQSFVAVDLDDSPLGTDAERFPEPVLSAASVNISQGSSHGRTRKASFSARTWLALQSSVLSATALLQHVRVARTAASYIATDYIHNVPTSVRSSSETLSGYAGRPPSGWRAQRCDVSKFTSSAPDTDRDAVPYLVFHLVEVEESFDSGPHTSASFGISLHDYTFHLLRR